MKLETKERSIDYLCPRDCPRRSSDCHAGCEQHERYRELRAIERAESSVGNLTAAGEKKIFRYNRKWMK